MLQRYITSRGGGEGVGRTHGGQEHIQVRVKVWNMLSKGGSVCVCNMWAKGNRFPSYC